MAGFKKGRWLVVWSWPRGKMAWFFWHWRPSFFNRSVVWRVGPVTVWRDD